MVIKCLQKKLEMSTKPVGKATYSKVTLRQWRAGVGQDSRSSPPVGGGALLENNLGTLSLFAEIKPCGSVGVGFVLRVPLAAGLVASLESGRAPRLHPFSYSLGRGSQEV